jgi:hypothetical protein
MAEKKLLLLAGRGGVSMVSALLMGSVRRCKDAADVEVEVDVDVQHMLMPTQHVSLRTRQEVTSHVLHTTRHAYHSIRISPIKHA